MARKKKENKVVVNNDTLAYNGEVSITVMHGKKTIKTMKNHNEGFAPFFEFLMYCLVGTFYTNKTPAYLRVFDASDNELTLRAIPTTGAPQYSVATDGKSSSVVITFNVASTALSSLNGIKKYRLYSRENATSDNVSNQSASTESANAINLTKGSSLIVAWKLTIGNASSI